MSLFKDLTFKPCLSLSLSLKTKLLVVKVLLSLVASFFVVLRFNHFNGGEHYLRFGPAVCEPFIRLFDTDVCWYLAAVEL